jgi:threonine synthase
VGEIRYYSTNNRSESSSFQEALMKGLASDYGLYMIAKADIPRLAPSMIDTMKGMTYAQIAFEVLYSFLRGEISQHALRDILDSAYDEALIPTRIEHVTGRTYLMWLSSGPTYSFKDYAARFLGKMLDYFLKQSGLRRVVAVATSGDTGGAVADALHGLESIHNVVLFPKGSITEHQRRQMTTLKDNIFAVEVSGDFDVCQALVKCLLGDDGFAKELFDDPERFTSANSISLGRLLPQAVYPFFAYSRIAERGEPMIASVPSGNFGDMMGTVIAKEMGLPISRILCGVNENIEFPEFLESGEYIVRPSIKCPSSAMIVSNPSNFARLVDLYGGHVSDQRDERGQILKEGVMDIKPDLEAMRRDLFSMGVTNEDHYAAMKEVYERFGIITEPHGSVGWRVLDTYLGGKHDRLSVIYETADPGKFPDDVKRAIGTVPPMPERIAKQATMEERVYSIEEPPGLNNGGSLIFTSAQYEKLKGILKEIFEGS